MLAFDLDSLIAFPKLIKAAPVARPKKKSFKSPSCKTNAVISENNITAFMITLLYLKKILLIIYSI